MFTRIVLLVAISSLAQAEVMPIQPLSGNWTISNGASTSKNCMAGMEAAVNKRKMLKDGKLEFSQPFKMTDVFKAENFTNSKIGANNYHAEFTGAGNSQNMQITYDLTVLSPQQMNGVMRTQILIPGLVECTVKTPFNYQRQ